MRGIFGRVGNAVFATCHSAVRCEDAIAIPDAELEPFAREAAVAWCNQTRRAVTDENMEYFMSRWRSLEPFRVDVAQIRART